MCSEYKSENDVEGAKMQESWRAKIWHQMYKPRHLSDKGRGFLHVRDSRVMVGAAVVSAPMLLRNEPAEKRIIADGIVLVPAGTPSHPSAHHRESMPGSVRRLLAT